MTTAGGTNSITIGSFTLADGDAIGGTGCTGIKLTDTSSTVNYEYGADAGTWVATPHGTATNVTGGPGASLPSVLFQALLDTNSSTTSMVTGIVGDFTGPAEVSGNLPCDDVGGFAGT
jgi:hypothetical protein